MSSASAKPSASRAPATPTPPEPPYGGFEEAGPVDYVQVFRATPLDRIELVKSRLPASQAKTIMSDLDIAAGAASRALNVPVSTLNRKTKMGDRLTQDESERVLGLARLIGQVQSMVDESGDPANFDARKWTARWLGEPLPALGGARPLDLMDTMEGQGLVSDTLARIQSGAYD